MKEPNFMIHPEAHNTRLGGHFLYRSKLFILVFIYLLQG